MVIRTLFHWPGCFVMVIRVPILAATSNPSFPRRYSLSYPWILGLLRAEGGGCVDLYSSLGFPGSTHVPFQSNWMLHTSVNIVEIFFWCQIQSLLSIRFADKLAIFCFCCRSFRSSRTLVTEKDTSNIWFKFLARREPFSSLSRSISFQYNRKFDVWPFRTERTSPETSLDWISSEMQFESI